MAQRPNDDRTLSTRIANLLTQLPAGKWKDYPDYGVAEKGRIALQNHGNKAYFKNIRIRELN